MPESRRIGRRILSVLLMLWPILVVAVLALIVVLERVMGIGVYRTTSLAMVYVKFIGLFVTMFISFGLGLRLWRSSNIAS